MSSYQTDNYREQGGSNWVVGGTLEVASGGTLDLQVGSTVQRADLDVSAQQVYHLRTRNTIAEINAGKTLIDVPAGVQFRLIDAWAIAYGGAVGATTSVQLKCGSTILVEFAQANLTQSTVLRAGATGASVLANGASFVAQTAGNDVTVVKNGDNLTTATGVDILITYALEG